MSAINNPVKESFYRKNFLILNNITHISIHFLTHKYFKKLQTTILKLLYQIHP